MAGKAVFRKIASKLGDEGAKSLLYGSGGAVINNIYNGDEGQVFGSSGNLSDTGAKKLLSDFYYAKPGEFSFTEIKKGKSLRYAINKNGKKVDNLALFKKGKRFRLAQVDQPML